jgi:hypothetical protein
MYFEKFPTITYSLDGNQTSFVITDIFRRVVANAENLLTATAYDEHDIQDGDTPEILAHRLYGNVNLHWVILILNGIIDPRWDWPLTSQQLRNYITDKYGAGNEYGLHHYVTNDSYADVVHSSYAGAKLPVTNTDYEEELNNARRRISVLQPRFVPEFINRFNGILINGDQ